MECLCVGVGDALEVVLCKLSERQSQKPRRYSLLGNKAEVSTFVHVMSCSTFDHIFLVELLSSLCLSTIIHMVEDYDQENVCLTTVT
jgi:hypothetical protein